MSHNVRAAISPNASPENFKNYIFVEGFKTEAIIGVYDYEREKPQPLIIDIHATLDFSTVCASEDLEDTISYADLAETIDNFVRFSSEELLEILCKKLVEALLAKFPIDYLSIRINKPRAIEKADASGVKMEFSRSEGQRVFAPTE